MKRSSAVNKGKRLVERVKEMILEEYPNFEDWDLLVTANGCPGVDLQFSPRLLKELPLAPEMKNQQNWKVQEWWRQTLKNAGALVPILVISKNQQKIPLVVLGLDDFLKLTKRESEIQKL